MLFRSEKRLCGSLLLLFSLVRIISKSSNNINWQSSTMLPVVMVGLIVMGGWKVQMSVTGLKLSAMIVVWLQNLTLLAIIWLGAFQVKLVAWIALVRMSCSFDIH